MRSKAKTTKHVKNGTIYERPKSPRRRTSKAPSKAENVPNSNPFITFKNSSYSCLNWVMISVVFTCFYKSWPCDVVVDPNYFNWKLLFLKPYKTYQTHQTHPTVYISHHFTSFHIISHFEFDFFWHLEISQSTVYPSLQGREAVDLPGVHLGPRRQQHPADLRVAFAASGEPRAALAGHRWMGRRGHNGDPKFVTGRLELEWNWSLSKFE